MWRATFAFLRQSIDGGDGSTASGGFITISSGVGTATSSGSVAVSTSNAGTAVVSGDLLLSTGTASIGNGGALDIGSGSSASGLGGSITILVGSGTDIGGEVSVTAGDSSGAAGGDASIVSESSWTSSGGSLTLALGDGNTSGGAVTIDGGDGSTASSGSIIFSLGVGTATSSGRVPVLTSIAGTAGVTGDLLLSTRTASVGDSGALDIGCEYDSFKYASVIGSCGLDVDSTQHRDGDNTIFGDRGIQPFSRQRAGIALGQAFYRDADTILPNNLCNDEFLDISDYDGAWWLASIAVLAFLTFKDVTNFNRLFFLHAFT